MLRTETKKSREDHMKDYQAKYLINQEVEWLIECGEIRESVYFRGATGDRYTTYIATKRQQGIIDFHTTSIWCGDGTNLGHHIAILRGYTLEMITGGNKWYSGCGHTFKQLMRQGVISDEHPWTIRFCRSSYFIKLDDKLEFAPWFGMKLNIKTGKLTNKPNRVSIREYNKAKNQDTTQRKRNYLSNKNNREALTRYKAAGGDTSQARQWNATPGEGIENINWDMIPMNDIFKHRNVTLRTNILNHYGINKVLKTLKYDVVDIDFLNGGEYKLLNVTIPELGDNNHQVERKGLYLEMINPSTGESHFEGVANVDTWNGLKKATVKEALIWRDGEKGLQGFNNWNSNSDNLGIEYIPPTKIT